MSKRLPPLDANAARAQWVQAESIRRRAAAAVENAPGTTALRRRELLAAEHVHEVLQRGRRG